MKKLPEVHVYIFCFKEGKILPYTLDHYSIFCDRIFLVDNMSTDDSLNIASKYEKVIILQWNSGRQIRDDLFADFKSRIYKSSIGQVDWVIVCDCDEFLFNYHTLRLSWPGRLLPRVRGFQMCSSEFPIYDGRAIEARVRTGVRDMHFDKQVIFQPESNLRFDIGAHKCMHSPMYEEGGSMLYLLHHSTWP